MANNNNQSSEDSPKTQTSNQKSKLRSEFYINTGLAVLDILLGIAIAISYSDQTNRIAGIGLAVVGLVFVGLAWNTRKKLQKFNNSEKEMESQSQDDEEE
jgi:drug/metabolite transporter (DMT)-like permease